MHGAKVHHVAGRYHRHEVTLVVCQHNALSQLITGNVSCLRSMVAIPSALVPDHLVVHAFTGQTVLHRYCNTHDVLLSSSPPEPMLASAVSRFAGALRGLESHRLLRSSGGIADAIGVRPRILRPVPVCDMQHCACTAMQHDRSHCATLR